MASRSARSDRDAIAEWDRLTGGHGSALVASLRAGNEWIRPGWEPPRPREPSVEDWQRAFLGQAEDLHLGRLLAPTKHNKNNPGDVGARAERSRNIRRAQRDRAERRNQ